MVTVKTVDGHRLSGRLVKAWNSSHGEFRNLTIKIEDRPVLIRGSLIVVVCQDPAFSKNFSVRLKNI
jgi:hypothetical protein